MSSHHGSFRIRIYPDFFGYTHRIMFPEDYDEHPEKYTDRSPLLTPRLEALLSDWQREFEKDADKDFGFDQYGAMLWIAFDLRGIKVAQAVKRHVGNKARVFFEKPWESPFRRYETVREVLEDGRLAVVEGGKDW